MKRLCILLPVMLLIGCAGKIGESYVGLLPAEQAVNRIAEDVAMRMATLYPPGRTTLRLIPPIKSDDFSTSLENNLRNKGFTVSDNGSVRVAWVLNNMAPEQVWYLRLKTADSSGTRTMSRAYGPQGMPLAGFAEITQ